MAGAHLTEHANRCRPDLVEQLVQPREDSVVNNLRPNERCVIGTVLNHLEHVAKCLPVFVGIVDTEAEQLCTGWHCSNQLSMTLVSGNLGQRFKHAIAHGGICPMHRECLEKQRRDRGFRHSFGNLISLCERHNK